MPVNEADLANGKYLVEGVEAGGWEQLGDVLIAWCIRYLPQLLEDREQVEWTYERNRETYFEMGDKIRELQDQLAEAQAEIISKTIEYASMRIEFEETQAEAERLREEVSTAWQGLMNCSGGREPAVFEHCLERLRKAATLEAAHDPK